MLEEARVSAVIARLAEDGLIRLDGSAHRTTRRWQAAMARAAFRLYQAGDGGDDVRVPIALAVVEIYGDRLNDEEMAGVVEAILPIEIAELDPRVHLRSTAAT